MAISMTMFGFTGSVLAQQENPYIPDSINNEIVLPPTDPTTVIIRIINLALGFLALIAVVLILAGGFIWMTAGGNDDKVAKAKKILTNGLIGLVIIAAAWGIAMFAVNSIYNITK